MSRQNQLQWDLNVPVWKVPPAIADNQDHFDQKFDPEFSHLIEEELKIGQ